MGFLISTSYLKCYNKIYYAKPLKTKGTSCSIISILWSAAPYGRYSIFLHNFNHESNYRQTHKVMEQSKRSIECSLHKAKGSTECLLHKGGHGGEANTS